MRTSKPISTISYNSKEFLEATFNKLYKILSRILLQWRLVNTTNYKNGLLMQIIQRINPVTYHIFMAFTQVVKFLHSNNLLFEAAKNTLTQRGDMATGWSIGWKINLWARLLDGNHAYKIIQNMLVLKGFWKILLLFWVTFETKILKVITQKRDKKNRRCS